MTFLLEEDCRASLKMMAQLALNLVFFQTSVSKKWIDYQSIFFTTLVKLDLNQRPHECQIRLDRESGSPVR